MKKPEEKKAFALAQILPYFKDPTTCGFDSQNEKCLYLTPDGRMCVAGKNMLHPEKFGIKSIYYLLIEFSQSELFKPEAVDILTQIEWTDLQKIHDSIAHSNGEMEIFIKKLNLFTYEELIEAAK